MAPYGGHALHAPVFISGVIEASKVEYLENDLCEVIDIKLDQFNHLITYRKAADLVMYDQILDNDPAKEPIKKVLSDIQNPLAFPSEVNIAIAAQVTAYGRVLIRDFIHRIIKLGGKVAYTATDSVYTNLDMQNHPDFKGIVGPDLGQFKLERTFREGVWARCGLYGLDRCSGTTPQILKHSGYNKGDITYDQIKDLALHGIEIYRETTM